MFEAKEMNGNSTPVENDQICETSVRMNDIAKSDFKNEKSQILYKVEDKPPIFLSILLGFQQYITMYGGAVAYPFVVSNLICMAPDDPNRSYLMQTVFFTSGLATLVQVMYGTRLPLIQGASFGFLIPFLAMSDLPENRCPAPDVLSNMTSSAYEELWTTRMRVIQGSILLGGFAEVLVGGLGLMGMMLKLISPVILGPTIIQLGLSLSQVAMKEASQNWTFSLLTIVLLVIFTLYMENVYIPFPNLLRKYVPSNRQPKEDQVSGSSSTIKIHLFKLFPVLITIITIWLISAVCSHYDWIAKGDPARTDGHKMRLIQDSPFFRIPMPFQWGWPSISTSAVIGVFCAVLISIFESVGDYFACAKLCEAPPPPRHVINRGILTEGIGCIFAGAFGTGGGVTSYSENIGAIAITKVGSRQVITVSAILMIIVSLFVKLSALFATIPAPIIGGILAILCGIITAVGISIIKFVNLNNTRNLFIVGVSTFCGLSFPAWFKDHPEQIGFGNNESLNRLLTVLIRNPMFVTGLLAFVLDNTIGGASDEDRGISHWINLDEGNEEEVEDESLNGSKNGDANNNTDGKIVAIPSSLRTESDLTARRVYGLPKHCNRLKWMGKLFPKCLQK